MKYITSRGVPQLAHDVKLRCRIGLIHDPWSLSTVNGGLWRPACEVHDPTFNSFGKDYEYGHSSLTDKRVTCVRCHALPPEKRRNW